MDGLFVWIVIISAIVSIFSKSAKQKETAKKAGVATNEIPDQIKNMLQQYGQGITLNGARGEVQRARRPEIKGTPEVAREVRSIGPDSYGEGFSDQEGTSFGDGLKGTEGECMEEQHIHFAETAPAMMNVEPEAKRWKLDGVELQSAFLYSEILGAPRCRKGYHR